MLVILFGYPGVGKTFIGEIMRDDFNFFFYEGDDDLTPEIKELVKRGKIIGDSLRDDYFHLLIKKLKKLQNKHAHIVFSQAFIKEKHRALFLKHFPEAKFLFVKTPMKIIKKRLKSRRHLINEECAGKIINYYEEPKIAHQIIANDSGKEKIKTQLHKIFNIA